MRFFIWFTSGVCVQLPFVSLSFFYYYFSHPFTFTFIAIMLSFVLIASFIVLILIFIDSGYLMYRLWRRARGLYSISIRPQRRRKKEILYLVSIFISSNFEYVFYSNLDNELRTHLYWFFLVFEFVFLFFLVIHAILYDTMIDTLLVASRKPGGLFSLIFKYELIYFKLNKTSMQKEHWQRKWLRKKERKCGKKLTRFILIM